MSSPAFHESRINLSVVHAGQAQDAAIHPRLAPPHHPHWNCGLGVFPGIFVSSSPCRCVRPIRLKVHHLFRWMLLGFYCVVIMLYLRTAWELKLIPSFVSSPLFQGLFYPALTLPDLGGAAFIGDWAVHWSRGNSIAPHGLLE